MSATENNSDNEEKKEIEIVNGDGTDLNISPVYDHIKLDEDEKKHNEEQEIVVPEKRKNKS